jgi:tRNA A-37 threonylcarbamoyl transferase component Bud32
MADEELYRLDDGRRLRCTSVARLLPGKRKVCRGVLDDLPVFVKLYLDSGRGERHWQRELDGLRLFQERGILTASILYAGRLGKEAWPTIVLESLTEAQGLKDVWEQGEKELQERLLEEMVELLAGHHKSGICQTDLHLNNFVLSSDRIYSLDGAGVKGVAGELGRTASLDNLALFLAQLLPQWDSRIADLYRRYCDGRGWPIAAGDETGLMRRVRLTREQRWQDYRKKIFRECTAFRRRTTEDRLEIVSKRDLTSGFEALLESPDSLIENQEVPPVDARINGDLTAVGGDPDKSVLLKDGVTCKVWAVNNDDFRAVVKRYNTKPLWRRIKFRLLFGRGLLSLENANFLLFFGLLSGRALVSWENAHLLSFFGIKTPRPLAVLRIKRDAVRSTAYFITEAVAGIRANWWFLDDRVPIEQKSVMAGKVATLLRQLADQRISHGDLKAANILIVGDEPVLIDLDAMVKHRYGNIFRYHWGRDMQRFLQAWDNAPEIKKLMRQALDENGIGPQ